MVKRFLICLLAAILQTSAAFAAAPTSVSCNEQSDESYIFRVKNTNQRFLLLDTTQNVKSKFFLMGIDYYGQGSFDEFASQKFETDQMVNVGFKLNHTLLSEGLKNGFTHKYYKLPKKLTEHIDYEHIWRTEGSGFDGKNAMTDYQFKCGITLLSQDELIKYQSRIGVRDNLKNGEDSCLLPGWWLRTGAYNGEMIMVNCNETTHTVFWGANDPNPAYRPVFYVDKDFFANVPIDLNTAGENIIELFKKNYTAGELLKIYSNAEVYDTLGYKSGVDVAVNSFSDGEKEIASLKGVLKAEAKGSVCNNKNTADSGAVVMSYYNVFGGVVKTESIPVLLQSGEKRDFELSMLLSVYPKKGEYIKICYISRDKMLGQQYNSLKYYCE